MDSQPKKRRLPALLERVTTKVASKTNLGLSDESLSSRKAEVDHEHTPDEKKESRLGRLGRGIRRWRAKRRKSQGELQRRPYATFPQKLTPSEESVSVHDGPPQTSQEEFVPQETSTDPATLQEDVFEDTSLEENVEIPEPTTAREEFTPNQEIPESTEPKESPTREISQAKDITPIETIQDEPIQRQHLPQTETELPAENEDIPKPIITLSPPPPPPLPTGYSPLVWSEVVPQVVKVARDRVVVFMRKRRHAHDFARSISEDGRAYWTDASHRSFNIPGGAPVHHGGIAVAHRLHKSQWNIHSAHVTGISGITDLESLAILLALQMAIREREAELRGGQNDMDERPVFKICTDNLSALQWIEKAVNLGIAIRRAAHKLEGTADDADDLSGLLTLSAELGICDAYRFDDYTCPEKTFATSIGRRILEEYYKLRKLGLVEFHWVPAHSGLLGNEIADTAASIASLWYARAAPRLGPDIGLVIPLRVLESRGMLRPGSRPTDMMALQTIEGAKDLWTVLMIQGSREPTMVQTAIPLGTITNSSGAQPMKHTLPPPTSFYNGTPTPELVSMAPDTTNYRIPSHGPFGAPGAPGTQDPNMFPPYPPPPQVWGHPGPPGPYGPGGFPMGYPPQGWFPAPGQGFQPNGPGTIPNTMSSAVQGGAEQYRNQQGDMAFQARYTTGPGPQSVPHGSVLTVKERKRARSSRGRQGKGNCGKPEQNQVKRRCAHCSRPDHTTRECFNKFPEQKQARPLAYKRWAGRLQQERVTPGAFSAMRRLHPRLKGVSCRGYTSQYMLGRAGLSPDLAALPTYRTIKFPVKRGGDAENVADEIASQYRRFLLAKYEWPQ